MGCYLLEFNQSVLKLQCNMDRDALLSAYNLNYSSYGVGISTPMVDSEHDGNIMFFLLFIQQLSEFSTTSHRSQRILCLSIAWDGLPIVMSSCCCWCRGCLTNVLLSLEENYDVVFTSCRKCSIKLSSSC